MPETSSVPTTDEWILQLTTAGPITIAEVRADLEKHNIWSDIQQHSETEIIVTLNHVKYSVVQATQELLRQFGEVQKIDSNSIL